MKITREQPFGFEFECRGCKSQLVAEIEDVRVGYFGGGGDERPSREYYVECPVCGTHRVIEYNKTTPKVRAQADKTKRKQR